MMKTAKLVTFGNYGTTFSSQEVAYPSKSKPLDLANFMVP
jgi:hypothetical protein